MQKIACDNCGGTIAHIVGNSMIEVVRQGHKVTGVGKDYSMIVSCPNTGKCNNKVTLTVEDGKVLMESLKRKEDKNEPGNSSPEGTEPGQPSEGGEGKEPTEAKPEEGNPEGKPAEGEPTEGNPEGNEPEGGKPEGEEPKGDVGDGASGGTPTPRKYTRV